MGAEVGWKSKPVKDSGPEGLPVFLLPQRVASVIFKKYFFLCIYLAALGLICSMWDLVP